MVHLSEIVSESFNYRLPQLVFVFVYVLLALLIPDVGTTLGLVAFAFLMWITVPWAFEQRVKDKELQPGLKREALYDTKRIRKPLDWLDESHIFYLGSGIFFMFSALLELFVIGLPTNTEAFVTPVDATYAAFFMGLIFLGLGMLRTEQVISFVLHPERFGQVEGYPRSLAIYGRDLTSFTVIALFGLLNVVALVAVVLSLSTTSFGMEFAITLVLGLVGQVLVGVTIGSPHFRRFFVGLALAAIPWVFLFLYTQRLV